ncbi:MAG TPA: sigma-70 family RNA polymerase sigma factor [Ktedonobacterales bacterium]|nr:sigma-70 family RNA polymerase sigma factor [Ktedonobacterales bacterium]
MRRRNVEQAEHIGNRSRADGGEDGRNGKSKGSSASPAIDAQSFRTLYQENLGVVYRFVYSKVGNREEAEDLTSQVFLKAVRGLDHERGSQSIQSWLYQVARTTIADYWRAFYKVRATSLESMLEQGWEEPAEERVELASYRPEERVRRLLELLPPHYREVLVCRFLLNLSIKETAERMGLSEANVKVLQFRALKKAAEVE